MDANSEIDLDALDTYLPCWREDQASLMEMVTLYISDTGKRLGELRAAIAQGNLLQVGALANSIRPPCETFGVVKVARACLELELACKAGQLDPAPHLLAQAELAFSAAATELNLLAQAGGG